MRITELRIAQVQWVQEYLGSIACPNRKTQLLSTRTHGQAPLIMCETALIWGFRLGLRLMMIMMDKRRHDHTYTRHFLRGKEIRKDKFKSPKSSSFISSFKLPGDRRDHIPRPGQDPLEPVLEKAKRPRDPRNFDTLRPSPNRRCDNLVLCSYELELPLGTLLYLF
jgi:hypothetical protein